jgi:hypothetical protein
VNGVFKGDETHWTNLMIDRAALLLPRLPRSGQSSARALDRLVHFLRIGLCVMRLRRCETPAGSDINEVLYHLTRTTETEALRERIAAMAASACPRQMNNHASLSTGWSICTARYGRRTRNPPMINDINIGGVFIPGLLLTALIALVCTLLLVPLFSSAGFTGVCPYARCLMSQPIS